MLSLIYYSLSFHFQLIKSLKTLSTTLKPNFVYLYWGIMAKGNDSLGTALLVAFLAALGFLAYREVQGGQPHGGGARSQSGNQAVSVGSVRSAGARSSERRPAISLAAEGRLPQRASARKVEAGGDGSPRSIKERILNSIVPDLDKEALNEVIDQSMEQ